MKISLYLNRLASSAVLAQSEVLAVDTSISAIQSRLNSHFDNLDEHFQFGSSTRATNLPRELDQLSDVDYMVVFNDGRAKPQAYLDRLRRFADKYYRSSEIFQSHPTIVLELHHIKFELVPARRAFWSDYKIPASNGDWRATNPRGFSHYLLSVNKENKGLILPLIRLFKVWNVNNGRVFDSFTLEEWIAQQNYLFVKGDLQSYFFHALSRLPGGRSKSARQKVSFAKEMAGAAVRAERSGKGREAISYLDRLFVIQQQ